MRTWIAAVIAATVAATVICYPLAVQLMAEMRPRAWIQASNLTVNYLIAFAAIGWMGIKIGERMFPKRKWAQWATLGAIWVGTVMWLKLWGYEIKF